MLSLVNYFLYSYLSINYKRFVKSCELLEAVFIYFFQKNAIPLQQQKIFINMKKIAYTLLIGGAMLQYPLQIQAIPHYLSCNRTKMGQSTYKGSKAPVRPLCIDVTNNIFTVPERLIGYTLTISNGEETYTYYITSNTFSIPENLDGNYDVTITNGNVSYQGEIKFEL